MHQQIPQTPLWCRCLPSVCHSIMGCTDHKVGLCCRSLPGGPYAAPRCRKNLKREGTTMSMTCFGQSVVLTELTEGALLHQDTESWLDDVTVWYYLKRDWFFILRGILSIVALYLIWTLVVSLCGACGEPNQDGVGHIWLRGLERPAMGELCATRLACAGVRLMRYPALFVRVVP